MFRCYILKKLVPFLKKIIFFYFQKTKAKE